MRLWISGSVVGRFPSGTGGGFHTSLSTLYMGFGISKVEWPFQNEWGLKLGLDFMGGISVGIPGTFRHNLPCP